MVLQELSWHQYLRAQVSESCLMASAPRPTLSLGGEREAHGQVPAGHSWAVGVSPSVESGCRGHGGSGGPQGRGEQGSRGEWGHGGAGPTEGSRVSPGECGGHAGCERAQAERGLPTVMLSGDWVLPEPTGLHSAGSRVMAPQRVSLSYGC